MALSIVKVYLAAYIITRMAVSFFKEDERWFWFDIAGGFAVCYILLVGS